MIPRKKILLPSLAAVALLLPSCVVVEAPPYPYYPRPAVYRPGIYAVLPPGYGGDYYWYGGRYYCGGRYEVGRFFWNGRYYDHRYFHNGRYYYGGQYRRGGERAHGHYRY